ncbi:putative 2-hydroxyacyl-CoA lyase [Cyphellophora attinorum]|uniref:Putative 2-hydroxyacyl-CoA lyase n=1 Tax=Cyphellophora attinorum TaxID=1664694 RepID=A0A0N1NW35_9EURO|nr:putative 2-hydroxyacyl-CoA lyase [Phialophora attinorum]KPI34880.1 putative 2-hydroxyacyl-CoA lyase [Phialophora attinorum]
MVYGAALIAQALRDLGVQVLFGLPGLPVIDIAQEAMNLGINFISFRNEQAAVLAASAYGYLTARPGVVVCVGGPGVLNTMAGIPHAAANAWPILILAGSAETHNANKAAFQEMDAINLVSPHCKLALRPPYPHMIPDFIRDAYRAAFFGRPGPTFVDLPANLILGTFKELDGGKAKRLRRIEEVPRGMADQVGVRRAVEALMGAKSPLVVVGKGAAYGRAEGPIREFVERTRIPFLPTPMGKGILPDSSPLNISAARSTALKHADVVLLLGARLNWILSFGLPPKWAPNVKIIQVDLSADELGKNGHDPSLSLLGDVGLVCEQLLQALSGGWQYDAAQKGKYWQALKETKGRNEAKARKKAESSKVPMTYEHAFQIIKKEVDSFRRRRMGMLCM